MQELKEKHAYFVKAKLAEVRIKMIFIGVATRSVEGGGRETKEEEEVLRDA